MPYVETFDRTQMMLCSWDSFVAPDSTARLIDAFVESLDLSKYGVKQAAEEGRPGYDPRGLFKLYLYGNCNEIRSSRKLARSCAVNIEVKWLMGGVEPDFRTISDFRKAHVEDMKKLFHEFNRRLSGAVEWGFTSVDGSKFAANNSKDRNFTKNKIDDRIKWLNAHTDEYLRILNEMDEEEELNENPENLTREKIESKLKEAKERLARYESYRDIMEQTGAPQMSLTDADSKLMKSKNGFIVGYNPQTAVDSETHLIRDFEMTNQATDHGQISPTMEGIRNETPNTILEVVADKGYSQPKDLVNCLENGIIPHVIPSDGKDGYELEISYESADDDLNVESTAAEDLNKCIHAGVVPTAYKDVITDIEVKEVRRKAGSPNDVQGALEVQKTQEEMIARAKEGYFVRDPERELVYCPAGEILRQKCVKKNGNIRYANKTACRHCPFRNKCYKGRNEWKEIDFTKDTLEKPCRDWLKAEGKETKSAKARQETVQYKKVKVVRFMLKPSREKMSHRMCLSEHPFGTIKRALNAGYFLLRGMRKVTGEFALACLAYNINRAKNLLGSDKMMRVMIAA